MRRRASPLDHLSEVRTKISDADFDRLEEAAEEAGVSVYELSRQLLLRSLDELRPRRRRETQGEDAPT